MNDFYDETKFVLEIKTALVYISSTSSFTNDILSYEEEIASAILFLELRQAEYHAAMGLATSKISQLCNSVTGYMQYPSSFNSKTPS